MEQQTSAVSIEQLAYLAGMCSAGSLYDESVSEQIEAAKGHPQRSSEQPIIKPLNF